MERNSSFDNIIDHLEEVELTSVHGRITEVVGMLIKAIVPNVKMGEVCLIKRENNPLLQGCSGPLGAKWKTSHYWNTLG